MKYPIVEHYISTANAWRFAIFYITVGLFLIQFLLLSVGENKYNMKFLQHALL